VTDRTEKLNLIRSIISQHVGWRNAISMKALCAAVELRPSELKADRTNPNAGYIPELRKSGHEVMSCVKGYFYCRPESDPEGRAEDIRVYERWVRGTALGSLHAVAETKRAPRYAGETKFEFDSIGG